MSLRSYDLESRRAQTFSRSSDPGGTFRRITEDVKKENVKSLFEPERVSPSNDADNIVKGTQGGKSHTLPKTDASWDAFEKAESSTLSLGDTPPPQVTRRPPAKSKSTASDKNKRHSGGLFGYISKSWKKRHSSASDKTRGKHAQPRKKRRSGHHSSSSPESDQEDSNLREMFEIKTDSENADYPREISELDKVLSMVVNSGSKRNEDYDLDKVTAVVVGSPVEAIQNPFKATDVETDGTMDAKYTKFDSTQVTSNESERIVSNEKDDFGSAECHSISDNDNIVAGVDIDVFDGRNENKLSEKTNHADQGIMPRLENTRKDGHSSSSSSSSASSSDFKEQNNNILQSAVKGQPQKFQLAATVMIDPRQSVEEGTVTYFGPVFLCPKKSEDGRNIQIVVTPGNGRVLRSPTPSEKEQIGE